MRAKLGLSTEEPEDETLIKDLLELMEKHTADYTNTFIALTFDQWENSSLNEAPDFTEWHERWKARLSRQSDSKEAVQQRMKSSNPAVIPRNHRVEEALERAENDEDYSVMHQLLNVLKEPYAHTSEQKEYAALPTTCDPSYRTFCGT